MKNKRNRILILLSIVLIIIVGLFIFPLKNKSLAEKENTKKRVVPVVLTRVKRLDFEDRLVVQGNLEAKDLAMVSPRIPGTIERIFVNEGDQVVKWKTKLFLIDSVKLQKAVDIRKQDLKVSLYERLEKEANLERVKADFDKAQIDYQRFKRLYQKKAITDNEFELQESHYKQTVASLKHAQTLVDLKAQLERQAKVNLQIAEKDLRDALVYAPINGRVSMRLSEPGEMGQPGKPIIRIENTSMIEVSAFLPAQYYHQVIPGKTNMRVTVYSLDLGKQVITYKSPTINQKLRTFEIKCRLGNPPDRVVPGAMAEIEVVLQQRKSLGIPSTAVQIRGGRSVVFVLRGETAHMVEVKTGIQTDGWLEVMEGDLTEKKPVVTMGQFLLNEGTKVRIQKEEN